MKTKIAGILFFLLLAGMGCIGGAQGFSQHHAEFAKIVQRNGADAQTLLPPTLEQLSGLELELTAFQAEIEKQGISPEQQAILLLTEAELNLIKMQQNLALAQEQSRFANLAFPRCDAESNLGKALSFFDKALAQENLAEKNFHAFATDYRTQATQTGINFETLQLNLAASQQNIQQLKETVKQFCP